MLLSLQCNSDLPNKVKEKSIDELKIHPERDHL